MKLKIKTADETWKLKLENGVAKNYEQLPEKQEARLFSARNDTAAFQLVLKADEDFSLTVGDEPWFSNRGKINGIRLSAECPFGVELSPIGVMKDTDSAEYADVLLRNRAVEAMAGRPVSVYAEISVPADSIPGEYSGKINVFCGKFFSAEEKLASVSFTLNVKKYVLPDPKNWNYRLDLWQHNCNIARKAEVAAWGDRHFRILEDYVKSLAALGQKSVTIIASEVPWNGQFCYNERVTPANLYEYSMAKVFRDARGDFRYDFSAMKKYIDLCARQGGFDEIEVFGLMNVWRDENAGFGSPAPEYPDAVRIRYQNADGGYAYMNEARQIDQYIKALEQFFISEGLIRKVRIAADEPADVEAFRKSLNRIRKNAPLFRYKAIINHTDFIGEFGNEIDDFVLGISCMCSSYPELKKYMKDPDDRKYSWYVCCGPEYPNTFLKSRLIEAQYFGILTSFLGLDGFLRWNYTVWPNRPRVDIRYTPFPTGDLNFVYPAGDMGVLKSLRWKALRRGIIDAELLSALKARGKGGVAEEVYDRILREKDVSKFFREDGSPAKPADSLFSQDPADYSEVRERMLDTLSE